VVECWHRVRDVPGSIPSPGRVISKTLKREILPLSQELRQGNNVMDKI